MANDPTQNAHLITNEFERNVAYVLSPTIKNLQNV